MSDLAKAAGYFACATALCIGAVLLAPALGEDALKLAMLAPLGAVLAMFFVFTSDGRSRAAWAALGLQRPGLRGWPLALGVPIAVLGVAYGVVRALGVATLTPPRVESVPAYLADLVASIVLVALVGGIGEEIGWRGYMLPRLRSLGLLPALLLSGLAHGLFHLPAILWTPYYHAQGESLVVLPLFLATLTAAGVCYGYLRLTTGSVWPAALAHSTFNIVWDRLNACTRSDSPRTLEYLAGESGLVTLLALGAVAAWLAWRLPRRLRTARSSVS